VLAKGVMPILGPRTQGHSADNLGALRITLDSEQMMRLDNASAPALGSPHEKFQLSAIKDNLTGSKADQITWPDIALR